MPAGQPQMQWEASSASRTSISSSLPTEVVTCLKNAQFLHLATCYNETPHVSLMNYTYLPSTPFSASPTIIMTTNPSSKKTDNLIANPRVSLLVHDWVSHRPPTVSSRSDREGSPPPEAARSSLASLLLSMNTSALSRISATINGEARMVEVGSEEERWCKEMHLENNTFGEQSAPGESAFSATAAGGGGGSDSNVGDGGRGCFIEGEAVRVVVVKIKDGRIADWKGGVQDWTLAPPEDKTTHKVNGI